jgi:flagella basal body P-ring formation protein FlgA
MISKSSIPVGTVLIFESFQAAPVVKSGDKVTAQSNVGNVMITVEAFARQDGAEGEIIKIQTKDKKQFKARVLNFENVLIIE